MGTEDWVLKGTKLITNTRNQKLKIQSRVWNFKNTMLKKRRRKRKRKQKQSHKNYKEDIGTKLITNTKKHKLKIQSRVGISDIQCYIKEEEKETEKKKVTEIVKKIY